MKPKLIRTGTRGHMHCFECTLPGLLEEVIYHFAMKSALIVRCLCHATHPMPKVRDGDRLKMGFLAATLGNVPLVNQLFPVGEALPKEVLSGAYLGGSLDVVRMLRSRFAPEEFQPIAPMHMYLQSLFDPVRHVCHCGNPSLQRELAKEFPQFLVGLLEHDADASVISAAASSAAQGALDSYIVLKEMLQRNAEGKQPTRISHFLECAKTFHWDERFISDAIRDSKKGVAIGACRSFGAHLKALGVRIDGETIIPDQMGDKLVEDGLLVQALQAPCVTVGPKCLAGLFRVMSHAKALYPTAIDGTKDLFRKFFADHSVQDEAKWWASHPEVLCEAVPQVRYAWLVVPLVLALGATLDTMAMPNLTYRSWLRHKWGKDCAYLPADLRRLINTEAAPAAVRSRAVSLLNTELNQVPSSDDDDDEDFGLFS